MPADAVTHVGVVYQVRALVELVEVGVRLPISCFDALYKVFLVRWVREAGTGMSEVDGRGSATVFSPPNVV